jgi:hypothetical protein
MPKMMSPVRLQKTTISAMSRFYSPLAGVKDLAGLKLWQASRAFMGWYILRRWKWDNRGWVARLKDLTKRAEAAMREKVKSYEL